MNIQYNKVAAYPMKIRLYPTIEQAAIIDQWLLGIQKAYNMTLFALREGTPELRNEKGFPNWKYIPSKAWLDILRSKSPYVAAVPGGCLSSNVGGALNADLKKAWESQGKLPVDRWFQAVDPKGHHIVRWYSERKPRSSCFFQIEAKKITRKSNSVYIDLRRGFRIKARGWNNKIRFSENSDKSFFEEYSNSDQAFSLRISRDACHDYYAVLTLKNVYRPTKVKDTRSEIGIDAGIDALASDSDGVKYENPQISKHFQKERTILAQQLSRRYGPKNEHFRKDRTAARSFNTRHAEDIQEERIEPIQVLPSRRYTKSQDRLSRLEQQIRRKRDMMQHIHTARIIEKAKMAAIENLNVKAMVKNTNLSYSVSDAAMSEFLRKLKYKMEWSGGTYHAIGTFTASTQRCSHCGHILGADDRLTLSDRTFTCPICGYVDDRDINAAKSILQIAQQEILQGVPSADTIKSVKKPKKRSYPDKPISKAYPNVYTHFSEEFVQEKKNPFVIVDENQTVLDDAQGYGYSTRQSAQKFWIHKMKS